jgi:hypothetical protein
MGVDLQETDSVYVDLQDQISSQKRAWLYQIVELEKQVQELKEEIQSLRGGEKCFTCGRGGFDLDVHVPSLRRS